MTISIPKTTKKLGLNRKVLRRNNPHQTYLPPSKFCSKFRLETAIAAPLSISALSRRRPASRSPGVHVCHFATIARPWKWTSLTSPHSRTSARELAASGFLDPLRFPLDSTAPPCTKNDKLGAVNISCGKIDTYLGPRTHSTYPPLLTVAVVPFLPHCPSVFIRFYHRCCPSSLPQPVFAQQLT